MTTNLIEAIKADIAAAQAVIDAARPLATKLAEMQSAVGTIADAQRTIAGLSARLADAQATERAREDAIARWTIDSIRVAHGYTPGPAARHIVTTSRIVHGLYGREPRTETHLLSGLTPELHAVVLANADMLPAYIRVLDADAEQALRKHAQHVGRGYMVS